MKPSLLFLPFLALLVAALATLTGSAFANLHWVSYAGWAFAAALIVLWVGLDLENFKAFFARKGAKYGASSGLVVLLTLAVIVGIAVLTSRPRFNKTYDVTRNSSNTLSDQSQKIINKIKDKNVKVLAFFQDKEVEQKFRDLMELYAAKGANLAIQYIDPQRDPTKAMAEKITAGNTVIFQLGNREARVTTFNEEKVTNALVQVLKSGTKTIYFTSGHGEGQVKGSEPNGYQTVAQELENNKYKLAELSLLETGKVPDDADLVVVAGPKYDFKEEELRALDAYMKKGGPVLFMVDALAQVPNLNAEMGKFGLHYRDDLLILRPDDPRAQLLGQNMAIVTDFDSVNPITKDFAAQSQVAVLMPSARSLEEVPSNPNTMKVSAIAKTSNVIIRVKDVKTEADLRNIGQDRIEAKAEPVMLVATGKPSSPELADAKDDKSGKDAVKKDVTAPEAQAAKKDLRLVAVGSADFATNQGAQAGENRDMFVNITNYLLQDEDLISIRPKDLEKSTINVTTPGSQLTLGFLAYLYPFLFLGGGIAYWLTRRRA